MQVRIVPDAQRDFDVLPYTIQVRVLAILDRLVEWPNVSGAKPLRYEWASHYRIRTGDWRVIFRIVSPEVIVVRIKNRRDVYED